MNDNKIKYIVLAIATLASYITPFMASSLNIALPSIQQDLAVDAVLLSWVATSYQLATAVFLVPAGKIADIYGRIKVFKWGLLVFTTVSLLAGFVQSIETLLLLRVFQGLSAATIMTTGLAAITTVFPAKERGRALGINVAAVYLGLSTGPFIGGILTQQLGWRSLFIFTAPLGYAAVLLVFKYLKQEWAEAKGEKLDIAGSIIYAFALVSLVYGATILPSTLGIVLIICAVPGFIVFVKRQLAIEYPVFEVRLFKNNRVFAFSNLAALINYSATTAVAFLMSLYLQYIKGLTPQAAGSVLIIQPILQVILSPVAGRISDKKEPALIASLGMACTALGLFLLTFLGPDTTLLHIVPALLILGVGFSFFSSPNTNAIMGSVNSKYYGVSSACVSTMRLLGQMFSMATSTVLFSLFIGKNQITPAKYPAFLHSVHIAFVISTVLCIIGIFFSYSRGVVHKEQKSAA